MREHGILRRALLVFQESATKLRQDPNSIPPDALEKAAQLFQAFGEDYHEKRLEEEYILPAVKKTQNAASPYADILLAQHNRGREITSYILASTKGDKIPTANMPSFITALETFVRMYEHHAAIEDTNCFSRVEGSDRGEGKWTNSQLSSRRSKRKFLVRTDSKQRQPE
jgi:hemerythrin-like domain-containing protein